MWRKFIWLLRRLIGRKLPPAPATLPKGTRYYNPNIEAGRFGVLVVEKEPTPRTIFGARGTTHYLAFPYIVFIIRFSVQHRSGKPVYIFDHLQVGFSMTSLTSANDYISALPLSNYEGSLPLGVCLGEGPARYRHSYSSYDSPEEMANSIIAYYWSSSFTKLQPEEMKRWAKKSPDKLSKLFYNTDTLRRIAMLPKHEELGYGTQH